MAKKKSKSPELSPELCAAAIQSCACSRFRMATRALTNRFDEALQPSGLRATQLVILLAVEGAQSPSIASLARQLVMDPSTLNRNLRPLSERGLVASRSVAGGRTRSLAVTAKGRTALRKAIPLWQDVQSRLVERLGDERFADLISATADIVEATREF